MASSLLNQGFFIPILQVLHMETRRNENTPLLAKMAFLYPFSMKSTPSMSRMHHCNSGVFSFDYLVLRSHCSQDGYQPDQTTDNQTIIGETR